jgi:DNA-binding CsgD family transcriptional regulator
LLERDDELALIRGKLESVCAGRGALMVIEGEAGIGKSALLVAAFATARDLGASILGARASELEAEYPFGVVRQCLEPVLRRASPAERDELLSGPAALSAPLLLGTPGETTLASFAALHGLYWLVAHLAERAPLLISVDDAHWADEPSMHFLAYLARRVDSLPVMVMVATRPLGISAPRSESLADLLSGQDSELVRLGPLGEAAVARVLDAAAGGPADAQFVRACQQASGGNPFLLTELVRVLAEGDVEFTARGARDVETITPPQVEVAVRARLARLDEAVVAVAHAVAMLGDAQPLELVSELAGTDSESAASAADELAEAGLFVPGRLGFRHPLLRSAVDSNLSVSEREAYHRSAAVLLRRRGAEPERVAVHLLSTTATGDEPDRQTLYDAATRAAERGAPAAAVSLFGRLLEERLSDAERAKILVELGRAEYAAGRPDPAADHLAEACRLGGDAPVRGRALALLLQARSARSRHADDLVSAARKTIAELGKEDRELALRLEAQTVTYYSLTDGPSEDRLEELHGLRGETPGEAVVLGHLIFRRVSDDATAAEVADLAERAARQVDALVEDGTTTTAFTGVVVGLRWSDRLDLAERVLDRAIAIARHRGSMIDFANSLGLRAEVFVRRGMLREAEADARLSQAADIDPRWSFARGLNPLLQSLVEQGRAPEAARILELEVAGDELPDVPPMLGVMLVRAQVYGALGERKRALAEFEEAVRRRAKWGGMAPSWIGDILNAVANYNAEGETDRAAELLAKARSLAKRWGTPGALGQVNRVEALLAGGSDQVDALAESVDLLERSPARLELARALVALGTAMRRAGQRSASREPLRAAYDLARACGADGLAEDARYQLAATGVRLRRERLTGVESLTPSERRIADIAATGSSNAEIAQTLFLTVKTVEMHLTQVYRKLQISGRGQLADALGPTT